MLGQMLQTRNLTCTILQRGFARGVYVCRYEVRRVATEYKKFIIVSECSEILCVHPFPVSVQEFSYLHELMIKEKLTFIAGLFLSILLSLETYVVVEARAIDITWNNTHVI